MIVGRYTALANIEAVKRAAIPVTEVPYRALVHIEVALAQIEEIRSRELPARSAELGTFLLERLTALKSSLGLRLRARGQGGTRGRR